jgi:hypothetical protein
MEIAAIIADRAMRLESISVSHVDTWTWARQRQIRVTLHFRGEMGHGTISMFRDSDLVETYKAIASWELTYLGHAR